MTARVLICSLLVGCSLMSVPDARPVSASGGEILAAYHGLDELPWFALFPCEAWVGGQDGMPITFSVRIDPDTLDPEDFRVLTATGDSVIPTCATLRPATESLEQRTVLLAGEFGSSDSPPVAVEVTGFLMDQRGAALTGARTDRITPLSAGPSLVLAERFSPATPAFEGECPADTQQIIQLVWDGGVSGPGASALSDAQRAGVHVTLSDGAVIEPLALGDDDPDNFVLACLATDTPASAVLVEAGLFYDPADDPNLETDAPVLFGHR